MLTKVAGNGGNLLLCVGPKADGTIPEIQRRRLLEMGAWLKVNGESIYGSQASPFWPRESVWGTCTRKPGRLYLHVWDPQTAKVELPGLTNKVRAAYLLADEARKPLVVRRDGRTVVIEVPAPLPDPDVSVVAVEIEGEPAVDKTCGNAPPEASRCGPPSPTSTAARRSTRDAAARTTSATRLTPKTQ